MNMKKRTPERLRLAAVAEEAPEKQKRAMDDMTGFTRKEWLEYLRERRKELRICEN